MVATCPVVETRLDAWYVLGTLGGFDGWFHNMSALTAGSEGTQQTLERTVDFGSPPIEEASEVLIKALRNLAQDVGMSIHEVVVGQVLVD